MKKLCLCLCCLLLCFPLSSLAENQTLFFADGNVLTSIATFRDELYMLTYEGVFCYDAESAAPALITNTVTGNYRDTQYADWLCATNSGLYAVQCTNRMLLQIMDAAGNVNVQPVMQLEHKEESFLLDAAMTEQFLCLLEQTNTGVQLNVIDLATNRQSVKKLDDAFAITAYGDEIAYAAKSTKSSVIRYTVAAVDLATGDVKELCAPSESIDGLCASGADLYIISKNKLYQWQPDNHNFVEEASLPSGDVVACSVLTGQVAVVVDNSLAIRTSNPTTARTTLRIAQAAGRSADYQAFLSTHPEIELDFMAFADAQEPFIQDVLTQASTTDIYQLSDISILRAISDKKMAKDLAVSSIISGTVQDMYPAFANIFSSDGSIWAIPFTCYLAVPGYSETFFEQFDLPVPTTVMELLDVTEQWLINYADEYPEAQFDPFSNGLTLDAILRQYEVEKEIEGEPLTFLDADLADIVAKYQNLEKQFQQQPRSYQIETSAFNRIDLPHSAQYKPLILPIHQDAQAVISNAYLEVTFYVVNPYSDHVDEAIAFLESICTAWDDATKALLLRSCDQAIESPDYQSKHASLTAQMQSIEEKNRSEGGGVLQAELEHLQRELEVLELNRWIFTEEEIAFYKHMTDYMIFKTDDPLDAMDHQQLSSYRQLLEGKISITTFLQTLDAMVQMVLFEMND